MVVLQLGTTLSEYFEFAVDGLLMWAGPCMSSLALSCAYSHVSSTSSHIVILTEAFERYLSFLYRKIFVSLLVYI